jgi:hypothetical protein
VATKDSGRKRKDALIPLKRDWVFLYELGGFVYVGEQQKYQAFQFLKKEQFDDHHAADFPGEHRQDTASRQMLTNRCVQAARLAYLPGNPKRLTTELIDGVRVPVVNQWTDSCGVPHKFIKKGEDITPYHAHNAYIIPNEQARRYMLDTFATWVRNPMVKTNCALLFIGASGLGKDAMLFPVRQALGESNARVVGPSDLLDSYTDWMNHLKLACIDLQELKEPNKIVARIQAYIDGTMARLRIHGKYIRHYDIGNVIQFVFTRHTLDGLTIDDGDRRFYPYESPAMPKPAGYYVKFWDWLKTPPVLGALVHYFKKEHVISADFNPLAPPPVNRTKRRLMAAGKSALHQYLESALVERRPPLANPLLTVRQLQQHLELHGPPHLRNVSDTELRFVLRKLGAVNLGQVTLGDDTRPRLWTVRDQHTYAAMPTSGRARAYEAQRRANRVRRAKN